MTWIYPKPRTLSRLSVFPLPFVSADKLYVEDFDSESIQCSLEYWDKCLKSFRGYSTFMLSEQEMFHLDLPLSPATVSKTRALTNQGANEETARLLRALADGLTGQNYDAVPVVIGRSSTACKGNYHKRRAPRITIDSGESI